MQRLNGKYSFLICFLFIFCACGKQKAAHRDILLTEKMLWADTADAAATYQQLKQLRAPAMDSFYSRLATALIAGNTYELLDRHLDYYRKSTGNPREIKALTARAKGAFYNYTAQYDSARFFFEQAIQSGKAINNKEELAESYMGMATNMVYQGNFEQALAYHYQSLGLYNQLNDIAKVYRVYSEIAIDLYYQKEFDKAIALLLTCEAYYQRQKNLNRIAEVQSVLSTCFYNRSDYVQAVRYARSSLDIRRQLGNDRDIAESLNNLSLPLMAEKQWKEATDILRNSLSLMEQAGDKRQLPIIRQNLASCLWEGGHSEEAQQLLNTAITEARQQGQKDAVVNAYKKLSGISRKLGHADTALYYYKLYKVWNDSIYNDEKIKAISELNIKYETAEKEQRIRQLNIEKELGQTQKIVYLLVIVFIAVAAVLVIVIMAGRNRKNRFLMEKVRSELAANEKELDAFTKSILAKNKFIEELEAKLTVNTVQQMAVTPWEDEQISALYQLKILTEDDWTEFKVRFDRVYPGYINKLRTQFPGLAPGEQRQFLLIKLNIENKECAGMLGISIDSVKKNRYRLKKKCQLAEKDSLDDFVRNFGVV